MSEDERVSYTYAGNVMLLEIFVGSTFAYKFCRDIAAKADAAV